LLRENNEADSIVRSLCAIPFLPRDKIVQGYNSVLRRMVRGRLYAIEPLFTYFANEWLCSPQMISNICVFQCDDRTKNACESSNRTLRGEVRHAHPNIWHLLGMYLKTNVCSIDKLKDIPTQHQQTILNTNFYLKQEVL